VHARCLAHRERETNADGPWYSFASMICLLRELTLKKIKIPNDNCTDVTIQILLLCPKA